jgi:hypothetical protein
MKDGADLSPIVLFDVNEDYGCQEMKGIFQMQRNA